MNVVNNAMLSLEHKDKKLRAINDFFLISSNVMEKIQALRFFSIVIIVVPLFGTIQCGQTPIGCSVNDVACTSNENNTIDFIGGVADVEECRQLCIDEPSCEFLTYYQDTSFPFREACFLLNDCEEQVLSITYWCFEVFGSSVSHF